MCYSSFAVVNMMICYELLTLCFFYVFIYLCFYPGILEDETHFLFHCPLYSSIRHKHIAEFMAQEALPTLKVLLEAPSALVSRKVAMYVFYALKLREEKIT